MKKEKRLGTFKSEIFGKCIIFQTTYADGNTAIVIEDTKGESIGVLSVNIPDKASILNDNCFFAKTWSENELFVDDVLATGLFERSKYGLRTGYATAEIWKIKEKANENENSN